MRLVSPLLLLVAGLGLCLRPVLGAEAQGSNATTTAATHEANATGNGTAAKKQRKFPWDLYDLSAYNRLGQAVRRDNSLVWDTGFSLHANGYVSPRGARKRWA